MSTADWLTIIAILLIVLLVVALLFISEWRRNNEKTKQLIHILIDIASLSLDGCYVITYDVDKYEMKLEKNEDEYKRTRNNF